MNKNVFFLLYMEAFIFNLQCNLFFSPLENNTLGIYLEITEIKIITYIVEQIFLLLKKSSSVDLRLPIFKKIGILFISRTRVLLRVLLERSHNQYKCQDSLDLTLIHRVEQID